MHINNYVNYLSSAVSKTLNKIYTLNDAYDFEIRPEYLITVFTGESLSSMLNHKVYFEEEVKDVKHSLFKFKLKKEFNSKDIIIQTLSKLSELFNRKKGNIDIVMYTNHTGDMSKLSMVLKKSQSKMDKGGVFSILEIKRHDENKKEIMKDLYRLMDFMVHGLNGNERTLQFASSLFFYEHDDTSKTLSPLKSSYDEICNNLLVKYKTSEIDFEIVEKKHTFTDLTYDESDGSQPPSRDIYSLSVTFYYITPCNIMTD